MPRMSDQVAASKEPSSTINNHLKLLLMGDTKSGKTHYAMQAAEAGYTVIYINGDVAGSTLSKLSPAAKERVYLFNVQDRVKGGTLDGTFAQFLQDYFTASGKFIWNDTLSAKFSSLTYKPEEGHEVWEVYPSKTINCNNVITIADSWTRLAASIMTLKANDLNIDLIDLDKVERDVYGPTSQKATQLLRLLCGPPNHTVVVGHPREYIKKSPPVGRSGVVKETEMRTDWIKMVPTSTSNPHGLTMGSQFTDIGWITSTATGSRKIDFRPNSDKIIGGYSESFEDVSKLKISDLLLLMGNSPPDPNFNPEEIIKVFPNGTYVPGAASASATSKEERTINSEGTRVSGAAPKRGSTTFKLGGGDRRGADS